MSAGTLQPDLKLEQPVQAPVQPRGWEWYESVQGLRALAMLLVFFFHMANFILPVHPNAFSVLMKRLGSIGTDLFFVIAGSFAYRSCIRSKLGFWDFIGNRMRRVYPVYAFVLIVYVAVELLLKTGRVPSPLSAGGLSTLARNLLPLPAVWGEEPVIQVTWALDYIFVFWLLVPWLAAVARPLEWRGRFALLTGVWAAALAVSIATGWYPSRVTLLFAGTMVWHLRRANIGQLPLLAAILAGATLRLNFNGWLAQAGTFLLVPSMVLATLGGIPEVRTVLALRPFQMLGYRSYSFYLAHGLPLLAIATYVFPHLKDNWEFIVIRPVCLAGALVMTEVVHRLVERPFSLRPHAAAAH